MAVMRLGGRVRLAGIAARLAGIAVTVAATLVAGPLIAASGAWSATTSGDWSDPANWGGGTIADGAGFTATFASEIPSDVTVTLDSNRTLNSVIFGDAGTGTAGSWDIGGTSRLTLTPAPNNSTGTATITVNALGTNATATISVPLTVQNNGGTFVKNGVGRLILANTAASPNNNIIGGKTAITGGTLQISSDASLGGQPGQFVANHLSISNGATLRTSIGMTMGNNRGVTIGVGGGTLNINGGAMTYAGRFTGSGETLTTAGVSGLTVSNITGTPTDVNWDLTGSGTRVFLPIRMPSASAACGCGATFAWSVLPRRSVS